MSTSVRDQSRRPFHFMVTFWGEQYRNYFLRLFLPSLFAPNNLPLLRSEEGHRFFIATTRDDWESSKDSVAVQRLHRYCEPVWIEIASAADAEVVGNSNARYAAVLQRMNACFRMLLEAAYHPSAYGSLHAPDTIFSDGMVASILRSARTGDHLVLCSALRQAEEGVLADLEALGLLSRGSNLRKLNLPPRIAADLTVRHLHPAMSVFEEGSPGQLPVAPFRYWRMPGERGILLHTLFGWPVLMDFKVVPADHTRCLDKDDWETAYISENFKHCGRIRVVQDSDEFSLLSLTPKAVTYSLADPNHEPRRSILRKEHDRLCGIRRSVEAYALGRQDAVKLGLFRLPIRWHSADIDSVWQKRERRIEREIKWAAGDYLSSSPRKPLTKESRSSFWRRALLNQPLPELKSLPRNLALSAYRNTRRAAGKVLRLTGVRA
jgi:hypothetical protein